MTTGFTQLGELAVRGQGRNPIWQQQLAFTGAPAAPTAGVDVQDAVVTKVAIALREAVDKFSSRVKFTTPELTGTYTITINAFPVVYDATAGAPADVNALLEAIANAITLDANTGPLVTAVARSSNGGTVFDEILLTNRGAETDTHTTAVAATVGVVDFDEDATSVDARIFLLEDQTDDTGIQTPLPWITPPGLTITGLNYRGYIERFATAGSSRLYVEVFSVSSPTDPTKSKLNIQVGPGGLE